MQSRSAAVISLLAVALFTGLIAWATPPLENPPSDTRVVFLVRHADTPPDSGKDPDLTALGHTRAARLAEMLSAEPLAAIYVTATKRSHQTAAGFAIDPTEYPALNAGALIHDIRTHPMNSAVLVVAHSNTAPMILTALGGPTIADLPHDAFDRMYAVVSQDGEFVRAIEMRY